MANICGNLFRLLSVWILLQNFDQTVLVQSLNSSSWISRSNGLENSKQNVSYRQERFFPFYSVVRFENSICTGTCQLTGTCYTRKECKSYGGKASGTCAKRLGVCCIIQKSCGGTSHVNNTYFQNPNFPQPFSGGGRCTISISRCDPNVCQLRLDFLTLDLAQPNATGFCNMDSLTVTGGASEVPVLCGENTGQHVYIDFDGDEPIQISIRTSTAQTYQRSWNIQATQIACDCPTKAPSGCLQYYTEPSGTVKSFNYGSTMNTMMDPTTNAVIYGTRQLINNRYGICIAMSPNSCTIQWSQSTSNSFTSTGDSTTVDVGQITGEASGVDCVSDFVIVPNPDPPTPAVDRFCGNFFSTKTSSTKPFVLYVVTDGAEQDPATGIIDVGNRGFSLDYSQIACTE